MESVILAEPPSSYLPSGNPLLELLERHFGYKSFRPLQQEVIEHVVQGNDAVVLMPTGGGKSLCYQIPALAFQGLTVVVSPLIALMKDQVQALQGNGIPAAFLNSSLEFQEEQLIRQQLRKGERKGPTPVTTIVDTRNSLHEMRLRKSDEEIALLRTAVEITNCAHRRAMSAANPVPDEMLREWARQMSQLEPYILERAAEAGTHYVRGSGWSEGDAVYEFPEFGAENAVAYNAIIKKYSDPREAHKYVIAVISPSSVGSVPSRLLSTELEMSTQVSTISEMHIKHCMCR